MRFPYVVVALLVGVAGCGSATVAPVSGKVTLDGKPLAHAMVSFTPDSGDKNPGPPSTGKTDADGNFSLELANGKGKGAMVGKHKVSITAYEGDGEAQSSAPDMAFRKRILGEKYNAKTELRFEVTANGSTEANFDLKSDESPKK